MSSRWLDASRTRIRSCQGSHGTSSGTSVCCATSRSSTETWTARGRRRHDGSLFEPRVADGDGRPPSWAILSHYSPNSRPDWRSLPVAGQPQGVLIAVLRLLAEQPQDGDDDAAAHRGRLYPRPDDQPPTSETLPSGPTSFMFSGRSPAGSPTPEVGGSQFIHGLIDFGKIPVVELAGPEQDSKL